MAQEQRLARQRLRPWSVDPLGGEVVSDPIVVHTCRRGNPVQCQAVEGSPEAEQASKSVQGRPRVSKQCVAKRLIPHFLGVFVGHWAVSGGTRSVLYGHCTLVYIDCCSIRSSGHQTGRSSELLTCIVDYRTRRARYPLLLDAITI